MKIRLKIKILFISVIVVIIGLFLFYTLMQRSSMISVFKAEQKHSQQVFSSLIDMKSQIEQSVAQDYTAWDDMAAYVASGDIAWANTNLNPIFDTYKIDAFWVYRLDGTLLYSRNSIDDSRLSSLPIDPRQFLKKGAIVHFFTQTALGPCEIYAATVHQSDDPHRKTAPRGYFLVGRLWNQLYLQEIAKLTAGAVSIVNTEQQGSTRSVEGSYEKGVVVNRKPLLSWDGKQVAIVEIRTESLLLRDFNAQLNHYIFMFCFAGFILTCLVFYLVYRWFTGPLRLISLSLEKEDAKYLTLFEKSRDEFSSIAKLIHNFFWQREQLLREIKERSLAEEKILRAAREWRTTFDCIPEQVSVMNMDFQIVRVNQAFARRFNMKPDQIVGKVCYELLGREQTCPRCPHRMAVKSKSACISEYFVSEANIYSEVACSPIFDGAGAITGSVHIVKDITSRKDVEKKQRLALLGKLVADMAHEVNNPLMIISGRGQLSLMEDIQSPELKENLKIIIDECQRAKEIIQRLLKFAKPSIRDMQPVNIQACINTVINLVEHQFSVAGITFTKQYLQNPPLVTIDDRQMQEVFMNLFNNARESMTKAGTITVTVSQVDHSLKIEVRDTGVGMPPEVMKRMFEPFFTTKERGTGLGLAVCYGIIKSSGGTLRFESEPQTGTVAIITFPITQERSV